MTNQPAPCRGAVASRVHFRHAGDEEALGFSLAKHVVWTTIPGGGVVLDARRGAFYFLDEAATGALQLLIENCSPTRAPDTGNAAPPWADRDIDSLSQELLSHGILRRESRASPDRAKSGRTSLPESLPRVRGAHFHRGAAVLTVRGSRRPASSS